MIHLARIFLVAAVVFPASAQRSNEIVLTFTGVLKTITDRDITIEPDPDNQMTFLRTRRTKLVQSGKEAPASEFKAGTPVTIDAITKLNGDLEAITVSVIDLDASLTEQMKRNPAAMWAGTVLEYVQALPGSQGHSSVFDGNRYLGKSQRRTDVCGHVVGSFCRVPVQPVILRSDSAEEVV